MEFSLGDRVRVRDDYYIGCHCGRMGEIIGYDGHEYSIETSDAQTIFVEPHFLEDIGDNLAPARYNNTEEFIDPEDEGVKHDGDKLRMDLIPPEIIEELARVLTYGAKKYSDDNWKLIDIERYDAALMRHYIAWKKGEDRDNESGLLHLSHLLANAAFLLSKELENGS